MATLFDNHFEQLTATHSQFNIDVAELTEESKRYEHTIQSDIVLKSHQQALLQRCIEFENNTIYLHEQHGLQSDVHNDDILQTKIAVIGDRVGSGKSYVILSLISANNMDTRDDVIIKSYGLNNVIFQLHQSKRIIKTNVLVIPHNLTSQWSGYMFHFPSIKHATISKKIMTQIEENETEFNIEEYDLVIVTSTYYNKFAKHYNNKGVKFQRVIFDEVDNLNIPGCKPVEARFFWLVTASYGNVLYPRGFTKWESALHKYIWYANGITNSGFIKSLLMDIWAHVPRKLMTLLILKNSEAFVEHSINLPPVQKNIVQCKTPRSIHILNGIVDKHIIDCLSADDIEGAIAHISPSHKTSEENIINVMIQKYSTQLTNLQLKLSHTEMYIYEDENEKQAEITKLNSKINEVTNKMNMIKERIHDSNTCNICYDDINTKTITTCCQNSFCFTCIHMWLARNAICPLCKSKVSNKEHLYVVHDDHTNCTQDAGAPIEIDESVMNKEFDKYKNIEILLKNRTSKSKFLIFSNYDHSFSKLYAVLKEQGIRYEHLKGNGNVIKCMIDKYKNSNIDVLLVNSRHYGSGLNLENTTDIIMFHKFDTEIEKQVIGRADRFGRKQSLNVWYFLYENEL
jgi:SNF2 family DNA or RNA helicase